MTAQAIDLLGQTIEQVSKWFNDVLVKTGGKPIWITAVLVAMSYKYLLSPVFGTLRHGSSDTAAYSKRKE